MLECPSPGGGDANGSHYHIVSMGICQVDHYCVFGTAVWFWSNIWWKRIDLVVCRCFEGASRMDIGIDVFAPGCLGLVKPVSAWGHGVLREEVGSGLQRLTPDGRMASHVARFENQ